MLKALELYGFKSFPDRTRFEFPAGITVVVGPNGSGKSNIVDGIKWVLGEQSAKSLRGKEMADVIFKGSTGAGGRKPSNTAEASIILDNSDRHFRYDADEMKITRRVYRSGEGEYLINGEPCRLRDIRDLVRGTGLGADSYSLIEQGKVDQLLRASAKDRRAIFEEAAGISRFKAKKIEAERRLARVEQNLVRLADIVEEVGSTYRRIKSQAAKAARYKEHTERLQELRTHVGAKDWRDFSERLEQIEKQKQELVTNTEARQQDLVTIEAQSEQLDVQLSEQSSQIHQLQQNLNSLVQDISETQTSISLNQSRTDDLNVQQRQDRDQLSTWNVRISQLEKQSEESSAALATALETCQRSEQQLLDTDANIAQCRESIEQLRDKLKTNSDHVSEREAQSTQLEKDIAAWQSECEVVSKQRDKLSAVIEELSETKVALQDQLDGHRNEQLRLQNEAAAKDSALESERQTLQQTKVSLADAQKQLAEKRRSHAGASQRAEVIQELENRLEGVGRGVKDVLEQSKSDPDGPYGQVIGLVADIVKVNVQHAELVDLALGDYAQCLVVDGMRLQDEITAGNVKLSGRVRIMQLTNPPNFGASINVDLRDREGVVGRLDKLVQVNDDHVTFITELLGGTWLVKTMADAVRLRTEINKPVRLITLDGDVLEADGTMVTGPRSGITGIVSRRSELRQLHREIHQLTEEIQAESQQIEQVVGTIETLEVSVQSLLNEHTEIASLLSDERAKSNSIERQLQQHDKTLEQNRTEHQNAIQHIQGLQQQSEKGSRDHQAMAAEISSIRQDIEQDGVSVEKAGESLAQLNKHQTSLKVDLAKAEQQREDASQRHRQQAEQLDDCRESIRVTRDRLAQMLWQQRRCMREMNEATVRMEQFVIDRSSLEQEIESLTKQRADIDEQRRNFAGQLSKARDEIRSWKDAIHDLELKESHLSLERQQLAERLADDYGIDVATLDDDSDSQVEEDREAIDREITDLRKSIANIGSVNMDALTELEETQQRFETLDAQYQDLVNSKNSLEKIIHRINNDSRRLFAETLEAIRLNFQKLFRQSFGGGRADLVLEQDVDILEAGIEIMATPPGKPEFNNSLLSGGERALTAVSLLMAIFQFRPSPVCVLDEVDAPFDEANIGRFIDVLKSFLGWTKFVIVTHSKVTMTAATTLYGITMQESGVSKRVSVRFEDVSEDGQISEEAVNREAEDDSDQKDGDQKDGDQRTVA